MFGSIEASRIAAIFQKHLKLILVVLEIKRPSSIAWKNLATNLAGEDFIGYSTTGRMVGICDHCKAEGYVVQPGMVELEDTLASRASDESHAGSTPATGTI